MRRETSQLGNIHVASLGFLQNIWSDLTTLTYIELEHTQPNQHMVLLGVADIATQNQPFVALVASVVPFQAKPSQFFLQFFKFGHHYNSPRCPKLQIRPFSC